MAIKYLKKVKKAKLKFLYRQNKHLTPRLNRLLYNALIQPHFDYKFTSWFPLLNKTLKSISLCLNLSLALT